MSALREILAKFGVEFDQSGIQKGHAEVDGMITKLEHLGHSVAIAFGIHEVKEWFENIFEGARALDIQAQTLDMNAESLQAWKYAAHLADVNADMFAERLNRLQTALYQASKGHKGAAVELDAMGVKYKDAKGKVKSVEEVLMSLADAVKDTADIGEKKALVKSLFGKGGNQLVNLLNKGREGIVELREEFEELGGGYDEEFLEQSAEIEDMYKRTGTVMKALGISLARHLIPLVDAGAWAVERLSKWLKKMSDVGAITNAIMAFLGASLLFKLPLIIGYVKKLASMVSLPTIMFAALVLLVDDLITTFQGGESVTRDFLDGLFGDGTTERIVGNIKTISSEVGGLLSNFQTQSKTASDTALGIFAAIQTVGLVFFATFGAIVSAVRMTFHALQDTWTVMKDIANIIPRIGAAMGLGTKDWVKGGEYNGAATYAKDLDYGMNPAVSQIDKIVKTFQAMGNQTTVGPPSIGQALAAAGEERPDVSAFIASQWGGKQMAEYRVDQHNTFHFAPGSTKEQARQVAGAVDEANKSSYRAAQANLEHRVE